MSDSHTPQESQRRRSRGTGFPAASLADAARVVRELGKYGREHSLDGLATAAGHSTTNSGAFKSKVAAYREWGLITRSEDTITLTELGWRLAHPEDGESEQSALKESFFNSKAFSTLYEDLAKGQPLNTESLGNKAVQTYGVSAGSKSNFIRSFVDSAVTAGLAAEIDTGKVQFTEVAEEPADDVEREEDVVGGGGVDNQPGPAPREKSQAPVVLRQVWNTRAGQILIEIRSHEPLQADAFAQLGELVGKGESVAKVLGVNEEPDAS